MGKSRISKPFQYTGFTNKIFKSYKRSSAYIELTDGANIAADYYLPCDYTGPGEALAKFATLFILTPYIRAVIDPATGKAVHNVCTSPISPLTTYLEHGYAFVVADSRGHGASTGVAMKFSKRRQKDTGEILDWITAQNWCDGNIGMIGESYLAWNQLAAAAQNRPALKAIMPAVCALDGYNSQLYPGGIPMYSYRFGVGLSEDVRKQYATHFNPDVAPVEDQNGNKVNPADFDPEVKEAEFIWDEEPYIDVRNDAGESARDLCGNFVGRIPQSSVAIYVIGAWYDAFTRGSTELFATLAQTNPAKMLIYPGFHDPGSGFVYEELGAKIPDGQAERLRFFDHYLRGVDNGIENEPPVLIYTINGKGWRQERHWPLSQETRKRLYLADDFALVESPVEEGADAHTIDLTHERRYGDNLSSRWTGITTCSPLTVPDMTSKDDESLVYTSSPLDVDTEVTGHTIVHLWVSSSEACGDFFVYLEDVDESGCALMVTEGQLRAGWAGLHDPNKMTDTDLNVLPKLPWHGFEKADWQEDILKNGEVVELVIDLQPISWLFKAGHSIRLAITGSNWPDFSLHPKLSPSNDPTAEDNISPIITVHRGGVYSSLIDLPVIPPSV